MKHIKTLLIVLVLSLSLGCAVLQPYTAKYLPPVTCETKGLCALYLHLKDVQDVVDMFAKGDKMQAVTFTTRLGVTGRAKPMINDRVTIVSPVDTNIVKVKIKQGEEGYMLKASLDCGAK